MNISLIGYGKMGKTIEQIALKKGHTIVGKINTFSPNELELSLKSADVAIEFSRPETAFENITTCFRAGVPVICGTTAWLDKLEEAHTICKQYQGAFFYASNFSIGVNLFFKLNAQLAKWMNSFPEYVPEITEIHHTAKLDAPSGTAISLAEQMLEKLNNKNSWVKEKAINNQQIPIKSLRLPDVPGTHTTSYLSGIDTIEIKHTAHSREGFATGALLAAEWIVGKSGIFGMEDLLDWN